MSSTTSPLRTTPPNPITTMDYHTDQTSSIAFNPNVLYKQFSPTVKVDGYMPRRQEHHFVPITKANNKPSYQQSSFSAPSIPSMPSL